MYLEKRKTVIEFKLVCTHLAFNDQNSSFDSSFVNEITVLCTILNK